MTVTVAEAVGEALRRLGVDTWFGLMGDGNMRFLVHGADLGLRYYGARHESAAVAMADGYARVTGRVGVCTVTEGPGVSNALTGLTEAVKGSTPLLLLAGDTPTTMARHNQHIEQAAVATALGAASQRLRRPETIVEDLAAAFRTAAAQQRPVLLSIPTDIQDLPCDASALAALTPPGRHAVWPDPGAVAEAADRIARARRPVVLAGRGAVRAGAGRAVTDLADHVGALLTTSAQARGLFSGQPFDLGVSGGFASRLAARLIREADTVLCFGASLNHWTTRGGRLLAPGACIVHCDRTPAAIGAVTPVDVALVGDAGCCAQALLEELKRRGLSGAGWRSEALAREIAEYRLESEFRDAGRPGAVDPRTLTLALDRMLPSQRTVVCDSGHFMGYAPLYLSVPDAAGWVFTQDYQAVGLGLGTAAGAAVARPDRLTVLLVGDGGLLMSLGELETLVRHGLPVLVVAVNDHAYGAEVHLLAGLGFAGEAAVFSDVDLAATARGLGARGLTVRGGEDLEQLRPWLDDPHGPLVLDCKVDPQLRAEWFDEAFGADGWYRAMAAGRPARQGGSPQQRRGAEERWSCST